MGCVWVCARAAFSICSCCRSAGAPPVRCTQPGMCAQGALGLPTNPAAVASPIVCRLADQQRLPIGAERQVLRGVELAQATSQAAKLGIKGAGGGVQCLDAAGPGVKGGAVWSWCWPLSVAAQVCSRGASRQRCCPALGNVPRQRAACRGARNRLSPMVVAVCHPHLAARDDAANGRAELRGSSSSMEGHVLGGRARMVSQQAGCVSRHFKGMRAGSQACRLAGASPRHRQSLSPSRCRLSTARCHPL